MTNPPVLMPPLLAETSAEGVRTLTLNRPERLNAVNAALADALPAAIDAAAADDAVRAIVITGAGRGFCAGLDLAEPVALEGASRAERLDPLRWVGRWVLALAHCEKPVIAAINGAAAGAGFGLALACDLRIMAASARLTAGYVRRGLSPDAGVTWFLPRLVGHGRAADILLTGRDVEAAEAAQIGLVTRVEPDEQVLAAAHALATALAAGPPIALALTKRLLHESAEATLSAQLRSELTHIKQCFVSADVREALSAFQEKRVPQFRGR
ncbi:MAG: enoyl-CoA hydratase-related protein [Gemmatimonadaceae bacterium]|nr:enoyl-CoA hydratase-related protein [Gemmatimonadaceae bacterium]